MSNKLVRKKKNKPKYGWMQDEIDALARKDARDRQLAGYGVTMANHALEIGFWVLHDKFGFGKKRLNRLMDCINAYLVAEYNQELNIRQLPLALQKMKVQVDVCAEAKKVPQRCRLKMAEMRQYQGWIDINDRLPDPEEYVLVSFENFTLPDIGRYEAESDGSGAFYPGDEDASYVSFGVFVNAWMPLPKVYRREETES